MTSYSAALILYLILHLMLLMMFTHGQRGTWLNVSPHSSVSRDFHALLLFTAVYRMYLTLFHSVWKCTKMKHFHGKYPARPQTQPSSTSPQCPVLSEVLAPCLNEVLATCLAMLIR